jgi:catechol 2,3-dioxygenase-like lactoylglutathione lyase family enzyme
MPELFHVGLTVKDLQRSLAFYRDVAGMADGEVFHGESRELDTLTNNPGARLRGVHLKAGPFMLQLLEYEAGGGALRSTSIITMSGARIFVSTCPTSKPSTPSCGSVAT